jgi:cytochrome c oxidase subunit II
MSAALGDLFSGWPPPMLDPAGPASAPVATMILIAAAMGVGVTLIVLWALQAALRRDGKAKTFVASQNMVLLGGLAFPIVVLTALLVYALTLTNKLVEPSPADALRIRVVGEQWWWRIIYLEDGAPGFETANELVIPAGQPVVLELESADVIHSVWIPQLSGKLDMIPGRINMLRIEADAPGVFGGQCAEYCGGAHAWMKFSVRAMTEEAFAAWRLRTAGPAPAPQSALASRGAALFIAQGCGECHTVRGASAGALGPDLSNIGSRATVAAGMFPMSRDALARWIAESQQLKPGNEMPSYNNLTDAELESLAIYLEGLR